MHANCETGARHPPAGHRRTLEPIIHHSGTNGSTIRWKYVDREAYAFRFGALHRALVTDRRRLRVGNREIYQRIPQIG